MVKPIMHHFKEMSQCVPHTTAAALPEKENAIIICVPLFNALPPLQRGECGNAPQHEKTLRVGWKNIGRCDTSWCGVCLQRTKHEVEMSTWNPLVFVLLGVINYSLEWFNEEKIPNSASSWCHTPSVLFLWCLWPSIPFDWKPTSDCPLLLHSHGIWQHVADSKRQEDTSWMAREKQQTVGQNGNIS